MSPILVKNASKQAPSLFLKLLHPETVILLDNQEVKTVLKVELTEEDRDFCDVINCYDYEQ